ncbi:hypothetical protein LTR36_000813 [Oleoguttula mirabilis]|uniref:Uncharacterized protein n=1 Tax=Oleoguttula mirabilis TaxID=1507867 RepID=A0AAV9J4V3_9PEZI|nr:hypothetical protein LTR36_000813 [Oleoguttula mirabilis]
MQNHIFRPIPNFENLPEPGNREERVKLIIANLEEHHEGVRASILEEGRRKLQSLHNDAPPSAGMDIDSTCILQPDHTQLIANLSAPYVEGSGDPCALPGLLPQQLDPHMRQAPVPPVLAIAQEATQQLEAYDKHAKETRDYYAKALERMRASSGAQTEGTRDPRRMPTG